MEDDSIQKFKEEHALHYQEAVLELISNNTEVLANDILSFIEKPPLDSMDYIRKKVLEVAKKYDTVVDMEEFNKILDCYRDELASCCQEIKDVRIEMLSSKVKSTSDNVVFYKKDFVSLNKKIKDIFKKKIVFCFNHILLENIFSIFPNVIKENHEEIVNEISKYMKTIYQKQLLENFDIKVLVKNTILMNGIKEQTDRYLYTLEHSRLLNQEE